MVIIEFNLSSLELVRLRINEPQNNVLPDKIIILQIMMNEREIFNSLLYHSCMRTYYEYHKIKHYIYVYVCVKDLDQDQDQ